MLRLLIASFAIGGALLLLVGVPGGHAATKKAPAVIPLPDGWQPEGIASGPGNQLFVGSIATGRVLRINARTGNHRVVVPQREGRRAIGLKYDRGRLFVAGGPTGRAFVYDARTGEDLANVSLTEAPTFLNDVTVARRAAWFTDSINPQLYRLALSRRGAPATTSTTLPITGDLQYDDDPETFEVNGIAAARGGRTLLVVQSRTGGLFRVGAATGESHQVTLRDADGDPASLPNADGILLEGRTLYVVQNQLNQIAVVRLSRNLSRGRITATLRDDDLDVPTTVAKLRGHLYAVNARFGTDPTPTTEYDVVRVRASAPRARPDY